MNQISIKPADRSDCSVIANIGRASVEAAHRDSCSAEDMLNFLDLNYNDDAISAELNNTKNTYHLLRYNEQPAGFSNIVFDASHPNINLENVAKLDRIYLSSEYIHKQLGWQLFQFNVELAKTHGQQGIWLFTWVGNTRAVNFYLKAGFKIIGSHRFKVTETHYNEHHQMLLLL